MQCERLIKQIKIWYSHVQNETMAPARMISFIENHAHQCEVCLADPQLSEEIAKITEIILPESKIPKAVRTQVDDESEDDSDFDNGEEDPVESAEDDNNEGEALEDLDLFDPDDDDI